MRALNDAGELGHLLLVPGHEQGARVLDGDPHASGVLRQQLEAARNEPGLDGARLGIEAGVEQRGVGLARTGPDVGARLEQCYPQVELRQLPRYRAADHAGTDDRDVGVERLLHGRQYRGRLGYLSVLAWAWPPRPGKGRGGSRRGTYSPAPPH